MGVPAGGVNGYPFVGRATNPLITIGLPAELTCIDLVVFDSSLPSFCAPPL